MQRTSILPSLMLSPSLTVWVQPATLSLTPPMTVMPASHASVELLQHHMLRTVHSSLHLVSFAQTPHCLQHDPWSPHKSCGIMHASLGLYGTVPHMWECIAGAHMHQRWTLIAPTVVAAAMC